MQALNLQKNETQQYRFIVPIAMLFLTTLLVSALAVHRTIQIGPFIEPGGILVFPLAYFFSDILTEIYGYKISRQIFWYGLFFQFIFTLLINLLLLIPSTPSWHDQAAFETVFKPLFTYCIATTAGILVGGFANMIILSKWKILVRGKYFWLRSLTTTSIGEAIFSMIALFTIFIGKHDLHETMLIIFDAYIFKLIYGLIAILPISIFVTQLKKAEGIDHYDLGINYNPFKLNLQN